MEITLNQPKRQSKNKRVWGRVTDPSNTGTPLLHIASVSEFTIIWCEADFIQPLEHFLSYSSIYLNSLNNFQLALNFKAVIRTDIRHIKTVERVSPYISLVPEVALHVQVFVQATAVPFQFPRNIQSVRRSITTT